MNNNKILLDGCIEQFKKENELTTDPSETFELFALSQITKTYDLSFEEVSTSIVDGGNDGGIDSIIIIIDEATPQTIEELDDLSFNRKTQVSIVISQCKRENSFKETALDKIITSLPELFSLDRTEEVLLVRFNPSIVEKALIAREAWKRCLGAGGKLNISITYSAYAEMIEVNSTFAAKVAQLEDIASKQFVGASISYRNYSCEELLRLFQIQKNYRLPLIFKEVPLSTSYETYGFGYVGTVKLGDYISFLQDDDGSIREDLFESNVRHYQGAVDVNEKIRNTIATPSNEDFWWLNNGITIIASNPSLVGTTLSIDDVQIVNGLQTSYSIFLNHDGSPHDKRSVLVKVIINDDKVVVDHIIASTNSQNPVLPSSLRATDDVQREIELYFKNKGYYYDRRKNFYKNQGRPASKIFGIQTNAQAVEAIVFSNPHMARSKPTSLIKDDGAYNRIFSQAYNYQIYLNCCLIAQKTYDYYRGINGEVKSILTNFKVHLARVSVSLITNKSQPNMDDIININMDAYDQTLFDNATELLANTVRKYLHEHGDANLINMAKTKQFTDYLIQEMRNKIGA